MNTTLPIESNAVCEIVGIRANYLNKIVERRLYGIAPSLRSGEGKGSRRWFTEEDVFGIALVWWLFEAGYRKEVIERILRELGDGSAPKANQAAQTLCISGAEYLTIRRKVRSASSTDRRPLQLVRTAGRIEISDFFRGSEKESLHVLPVRSLFADLASRLKTYE